MLFFQGLRIDVMSTMRGCDTFDKLWRRRKTIRIKDYGVIDVIGLTDLVQSKKTQRDKDWLMLKQLVENDIILNKNNPSKERVKWWLIESRNTGSLINLSGQYPVLAKKCVKERPLLKYADTKNSEKLNLRLHKEELEERKKDVEYWKPLRKELETLRHKPHNPP